MSLLNAMAFAIIVLTLVGVAVERSPRLRMNRATIALAGAALLIVTLLSLALGVQWLALT